MAEFRPVKGLLVKALLPAGCLLAAEAADLAGRAVVGRVVVDRVVVGRAVEERAAVERAVVVAGRAAVERAAVRRAAADVAMAVVARAAAGPHRAEVPLPVGCLPAAAAVAGTRHPPRACCRLEVKPMGRPLAAGLPGLLLAGAQVAAAGSAGNRPGS